MADKGPRILLFDIETSLQPVAVFQLQHNDYINPDSILAERHMVSVSWKLLGEKTVHSCSVLDDAKRFAKDPHDDKHVCEVLHDVLASSDVLVAHNGDSFDIKYTETRMLYHGLDPLPPVTSIDTYKVAKSRFMFNSNKLNYIGKFLGLGEKISTTPGLWLRVLNGEKAAIREMVTYNKQDVVLLEKVFMKLRPYMANHINRELFGGTGCPRCGSHRVQSRGTHKAISRVYRRFQCQSCTGWFRSVLNEKDVRASVRVL